VLWSLLQQYNSTMIFGNYASMVFLQDLSSSGRKAPSLPFFFHGDLYMDHARIPAL